MKNKPFLAALSCIVGSTLVLTGCGSGGSGNQANGTSPNSSGSSKPFTLTVWATPATVFPGSKNETSGDKAIYTYIQQQMQKQFPGIKINYVNEGWGDPLQQALMLSRMSGTSPDVAYGEGFIPTLAQNGLLLPLPSSITSKVTASQLAGAKYNGKIYAVPSMTGVLALEYNKTIMKEAGLNPNQPPTTWSQWLSMSQKVTAAGKGKYYGTIMENAPANYLGGTYRMVPFLRQAGGGLASSDGTPTFNSAQNLQALTFLRNLAQTTPPGSTSLTSENAINGLFPKEGAFAVNGPWIIGFNQKSGADIGYAPLPIPSNGKQNNVTIGNQQWFVMKSSKHQQAALAFLNIISSSKYQEMFALDSGRLPTNKTALQDQALFTQYPALKVFASIEQSTPANELPVFPKNSSEIWNAWSTAQNEAITTNKSIQTILNTAQQTAQGLMK